MEYRISVETGAASAQGVLLDGRGEEIARAGVALRDAEAATTYCLGGLAELAGLPLPELLHRTGAIDLRTHLADGSAASGAGARIGAIVTRGFRTRLLVQASPVAVPEAHLFTEVVERVGARGDVLVPLDEESARGAARALRRHQVDAVAVLLLFSPLRPAHERRVAELVAEEYPGVHVALSSAARPALGEAARWGAALAAASAAPALARYAGSVGGFLSEGGFRGRLRFVRSDGGAASAEAVAENPALLLPPADREARRGRAAAGLPRGFRRVLSVAAGDRGFDVGFDGGSGARGDRDGRPGAGFAFAAGRQVWTDVEPFETCCPAVVEALGQVEDQEGAGEHRGAPGAALELTLGAAGELAVGEGGEGGGALFLCGPTGVCRPLGADWPQPVEAGDRLLVRCPGSAGRGDPLARASGRVQQDVIGGLLSVERARDVYGVVLNPSTLELQCDATRRLREELRPRGTGTT